MNTASSNIPILQPARARDNVIILEDLEFNFSKERLNQIAELHNDGVRLSEISKTTKRDEYEVLLAILHLHREGRLTKPLRRV